MKRKPCSQCGQTWKLENDVRIVNMNTPVPYAKGCGACGMILPEERR